VGNDSAAGMIAQILVFRYNSQKAGFAENQAQAAYQLPLRPTENALATGIDAVTAALPPGACILVLDL
jgi:hypothetical protein